jgi:hypothetical protein
MEFAQFFVAMKICPIFNPNETLHYQFHRGVRDENRVMAVFTTAKWAELATAA